MFNNYPKCSGIYHIKDNINSLQLAIHFHQINSLLKLPSYMDWTQRKDLSSDECKKLEQLPEDKIHIIKIKWQQKLFSSREIELYKDISNCISDTQKQYHQWLMENIDEKQTNYDSGNRPSKSKSSRKRHSKRIPKERKLFSKSHNEIFTYINQDNFQPELNNKRQDIHKNIYSNENVQTMYVYAALNPDIQLLIMNWYPERQMLHIYPDFNTSVEDIPYIIEIDTDYKHLYSYAIENISRKRQIPLPPLPEIVNLVKLPDLDIIKNTVTTSSPTTVCNWQIERKLTQTFAMPPKRMKRISFLMELREAKDFDKISGINGNGKESLYVRYHIYLPQGTILEEGLLQASTQSTTGTLQYTNLIETTKYSIHFGYNWQLTLLCEEHYQPEDMLHIFFEIISVDDWDRERIEGYTHYSTYLTVGYDNVELYCIRPVDNFLDSLGRYFIGGRRKFDFMHFFGGTTIDCKTKFDCRYGYHMQQTGKLLYVCQKFTQSNCELLKPCSYTYGITLDDIMMAYREARKRLEALLDM